jgi:hypothetical protein
MVDRSVYSLDGGDTDDDADNADDNADRCCWLRADSIWKFETTRKAPRLISTARKRRR